MKENIIKKIIDETNESLQDLNYAVAVAKKADPSKKNTSLLYDASIKRFENLFSKSTNLLRLALLQEGIQTVSPRQVLQEAVRLNWINDVEFWLLALDAKASGLNGVSDLNHSEYFNIISQFATEVEVIISLLTELRNINQPETPSDS